MLNSLALHLVAKPSHPLRYDLNPFLAALGSNTSITELNISGHQIGNKGAIALAKSLQINTSLNTLFWDENQIGLMGFKNVKYALKINKTLKYMPLNIADIAFGEELHESAEQHNLAKTLAKIETLILNNQVNS